jgi:hypothetical protein
MVAVDKKMIITSKPYGNNNVPSTGVLFEDRKVYYEYFVQQIKLLEDYGSKIPFADLFLDNSMYGLIDLDANLIELKNPNKDLISVTGFNGQQFKLLNFVADAYLSMKSYMQKALLIGKVEANNPMTTLQIHRAYIDLNIYSAVTKDNLITDFKNSCLKDYELNSKITDHKDFVNEFNNYMFKIIKDTYITRSSTALSSNFLGFSSGLIFDIANIETDDDLKKYDLFLNTDQFIIFAEACLRFGFRIDVNVPWRLIADINSPAMAPYLKKYNIINSKNLFDKYYQKIYNKELDELKNIYYEFYTKFLIENEFYQKSYKLLCEKNSQQNIVFKRDKPSKTMFFKDFTDEYWIRLYTFFKNYEFKRNLTQDEFDNIVRESIHYIRINKNDKALKYINKYFKNYNNILFYKSKNVIYEEQLDDATNYTVRSIKF